jgi:hypothetical protein
VIWASMHDLMTGLLYYDVEVFIFLASNFFFSVVAFVGNTFGGCGCGCLWRKQR